MDKNDLKIIATLREDARTSLTEVSRMLNVPISTIYDRLKLHNGTKIKKYSAILDFNEMGFPSRAKIFIKKGNTKKEELKEHLMKHFNVNSLYKINNGYDFIVDVIFSDMKELEVFLENIEQKYGVKNPEVHYILEELKVETFLSDRKFVDLVKLPENK